MSNELTENTLVAQVATLALDQIYTSGKVSQNEIHKKLGISRHHVKKIMQSQEYENYFAEINRQATMGAIAAIKNKVETLAPKALKALEYNLEENKMDAVNTYFKMLGLMDHKKDDGEQKDATINVFLPGQTPNEKEVVVKVEE